MTPEERDLLDAAGRLQRQAEREIDELTSARLRAARKRALDATESRPRFAWLAGGGLVAASLALALAGLVWLQLPSEGPAARTSDTVVADLDLLTTQENPEFYVELEFYDWLASQPDAG